MVNEKQHFLTEGVGAAGGVAVRRLEKKGFDPLEKKKGNAQGGGGWVRLKPLTQVGFKKKRTVAG